MEWVSFHSQDNMDINYLQLGTVAFIFLFAIREFFAYLKSRKNGNGNFNKDILDELKSMNGNHLTDLIKTIETGNKTNHDDHMAMMRVLSELKR